MSSQLRKEQSMGCRAFESLRSDHEISRLQHTFQTPYILRQVCDHSPESGFSILEWHSTFCSRSL
jgi:hypothetical protein